jgi:hypothetical protein
LAIRLVSRKKENSMSRIRLVGKLLVLSLAVVLVCESVGFAQPGGQRGRGRGGQFGGQFGGPGGFGGGGGGGMDALALVGIEQVQTELKIRDDQKPKIDELRESTRSQQRELFGGLRDLSREERAERMEELRGKQQELTKAAEEKLHGVLSADQKSRLEQIQLQLRGIDALAQPDVAKKLDIDAEQQAVLAGIFESRREEQRKLMEGLREGGREGGRERFQEMNAKREEITKKAETEAMAVLTAEQKSQFTAMQGEKFELDRRALFGGGRGGQQGQRGRGGRGGEGRPGGRTRRPNSN